MFETNFSAPDAVIVVLYLLGTVALGVYVNRHIHSAGDFLVGGRASGASLSIATLIGTELGLVTLMYAAIEGFVGGFAYLMTPVIWGVVTLAIGLSGVGIARMRRLRLTTIPEYFQRRYNRRVRVTAGVVCVIAGVLNMSIFPKMGAVFLTFATGYGGRDDIETIIKVITTVLVLLVLLYTALGGMVAVIVTDYVQFVVLSIGLLLGLVFCLSSPGLNWDNVVTSWQSANGEAAMNPVVAPRYGWDYLVLQVMLAATATICWAPNATRSLTTADEATTRRAYALASTGLFARFAIPGLWGIIAFTFLHLADGPQGLSHYFSEAQLELHDGRAAQAMPLLLGKVLPSIWLGILMAGLMAAFMSTHDSYLLAWSSVATQDVVAPLLGRELTSGERIWATRLFILAIGAFLIVVGIWFELPDNVWKFLSITGTIYLSGSAAALLGGMYWRGASSTGALMSIVGGMLAALGLIDEWLQQQLALALGYVSPDGEPVFKQVSQYVNGFTIAIACFVTCAVLFVVGSLLFPDEEEGGGVS